MMLWVAIAGCSWFEPDLQVDAIQPQELRVGTEIQVLGKGFSPRVDVELSADGVRLPLDGVSVKGKMLIEARIPDVEPGTYRLVVSRGRSEALTSVEVLAEQKDEVPCARGYEANTQLSLPDGLAIIERFYADGKRERVETPIAEIERLEYTVSELADGTRCAAILLRRTDGAAVLFEDVQGDLRARAETLAEFMDRDLAILAE